MDFCTEIIAAAPKYYPRYQPMCVELARGKINDRKSRDKEPCLFYVS